MPSICLAMIVKDESHIIVETLKNVVEKIPITSWCISDTGSTDGTQELITEFFKSAGISGELHQDAWVNFGFNRTLVLKHCYNTSDYVLMWDADDRVNGVVSWPEPMDADEYCFIFKSGSMVFRRTQMFNNRKKWKYTGVIHEYAECMEARLPYRMIEGDYSFSANSLGARALDPRKYEKDAEVLEKAYYEALENKDSIHCRYAFYCANSYRNTTNKAKTEEFYKKVLKLEGWAQEKYMSCLELFGLYESQEKAAEGLPFLLQSTKYDKTRVECVYRLIKHYCLAEMFDLAINYYGLVKEWFEHRYIKDDMSSRLFARLSEHDFYMPYHLIIAAERVRNYALGYKMYQIMWQRKFVDVSEWWMHNLIHNMQFFIDHADPTDLSAFDEWVSAIKATSIKLLPTHEEILTKMHTALLEGEGAAKSVLLEPPAWEDSGWVFHPQCDSILGDIRTVGVKPFKELLAEAEKEPLCVAINTLGWIKASVTYPLRKCLSGSHGIFVKKGFPFVHQLEEPTLIVSKRICTFADSGIDAVLYINLEHRTDRNKEVVAELEKAGVPSEKIHRIDAIRNKEFGNLGCSQSHTKAVEFAIVHPEWKRVAVIEDDFVFRDASAVWTQLGSVLHDKNPDMFLLGHNPVDFQFERTATPSIVKILATTHRTGYVVSASYMTVLRDNFQKATDLMLTKGNQGNLHGDMVWKELMPKAMWLSHEPTLGYQRDGYSDCEKSNLNFQY